MVREIVVPIVVSLPMVQVVARVISAIVELLVIEVAGETATRLVRMGRL